jgi:uncharacterized membrane protein YedE/YeeE
MFEELGFIETTAREASVWFGLGLGALFGALAQRTRFCFRRGVVAGSDRAQALAVWGVALAVALVGTQAVVGAGLTGFADHRFHASALPYAALLVGGLLFGAGMVLARGCVSRLTVLSASGNLRALAGLLVFAVVAHATLKGVLAPLRTALGGWTVDLGSAASLAALPGGPWVWTASLAALALLPLLRARPSAGLLLGAVLIGALVPLGWAGTGFVLFDEFDPIAQESLSFTSPWAETLFFTVASSSIPAGFGTGLVGGTLAGALVAALAARDFRWESFETPAQTGRSLTGAALMGVGGVLAGGCTVGAGLAGVPTLSVAALLALAAIAAGGVLTDRLLGATSRIPSGAGAPAARRALQPAE